MLKIGGAAGALGLYMYVRGEAAWLVGICWKITCWADIIDTVHHSGATSVYRVANRRRERGRRVRGEAVPRVRYELLLWGE